MGNKKQFKQKPSQKSTGQSKKAQLNNNNQKFKGRQIPSKNTNEPCDSDESSKDNKLRSKKSNNEVKNVLKSLLNKQQTTENPKRKQPKGTMEKNKAGTIIPVNFGKKNLTKNLNADKDCNTKELVQEKKKGSIKPKGDKKKYDTQSKKFVEQNTIEKEICANDGNKSDDSKQPGNNFFF